MSSNTPNLGLLKKDPMVDGNETFNIETMLNENWDKIDEAVGQVREELGNIDVDIPEASLTEKGIVQLSNATNGTRENVAATEKAVKAAYDEALAGKQLGVEQKANVVAALNSVGVAASTSETWAQLVAKMAGIIKATGNATAGDVLAGKTFSNGSGNGLTGTMPNRSAENNHMPGLEKTIWAGDRYFIRPPAGYYNGSTWVTANEPQLTADNIRKGSVIGGIAGSVDPGLYSEGVFNMDNSNDGRNPGFTYFPLYTTPADITIWYMRYEPGMETYVSVWKEHQTVQFQLIDANDLLYTRSAGSIPGGSAITNVKFSISPLEIRPKDKIITGGIVTASNSGASTTQYTVPVAFKWDGPIQIRLTTWNGTGAQQSCRVFCNSKYLQA